MEDISKKTVVSSLLWKFLERCSVQGIQFVLQIILARLLCPEDYGLIALILAFVSIANVFVQSGFNTALIQKKNADDEDFSTVFWFSLLIAVILYFVIFFSAEIISMFYNNELITPVLRIISFTLFFGALNSVQGAVVSRSMKFKKFFFSSLGGVVVSGICGIYLAYNGYGIWALVYQHLVNNVIISLILWFTVKWRPKFYFSFSKLKGLLSFSWKLLCSSLIDNIYRQVYNFVIGKRFSAEDLGFFSRGEQFPSIVATNLDGSIQSVMLPTISRYNDNSEEVKRITRKSIKISSFILWPCMLGMAAIAEPMVLFLLTEKWLSCVPYIQLACLSFVFYPIHTANLTAINAMGRSDVFLRLEIIKKAIGIVILLITLPLGIMPMAIGRVVVGLLSTLVNSYPNKKLLNYKFSEQIMDIFPSILLSIVMALFIVNFKYFELPIGLIMLLQILLGCFIYLGLSKLFNLEAYHYLKSAFVSIGKKEK